ncbi:MAG: LacI family transcriptional regulator [Lachnospiraceae bacterium]|nr:LacI family transcriptional regulator [Lachnospiraceae bacterium]
MTIMDVAERAGVSKTTVSRVLNRRGSLSEKTIKKVEDAMRELGYYPNEHARALSGVNTKVIGVVISAFNNPFHSELLQQIHKVVRQCDYSIMIAAASDISEEKHRERTIGAVEYLLSKQVNGIIFMNHVEPEVFEEVLKKCQSTPIVTVLSILSSNAPAVFSDDRQGGILAAKHLRAKGCKKVVHVSGALSGFPYRYVDERSYSFIQECEKYGISVRNYEYSGLKMDIDKMQSLIGRIVSENLDMDGIFLSNDIFAAQCVTYAHSLGYKIPDDIKIIGYDGTYIGTLIDPPLSTIQQDFRGLAEAAVKTVLDRIDGKETGMKVMLPVKLIERKTT